MRAVRSSLDDPPVQQEEPPPPPLESPRRVPSARRPPPRRPARAPRTRHWGRRIFALLALAAIGVALYAINATFQPFHGDGSGSVRVQDPRWRRRRPDRRPAGRQGRRRQRHVLLAQRHGHRPSRRPAARQLHAAAGDDQRRRDRRAEQGTEGQGRQDHRHHDPRGPVDQGRGAEDRQDVADRQLREGDEHAAGHAGDPQARRAEGHQDRRGLHVPGHVHGGRRRPGQEPRRQAAGRLPRQLRQGRHALRQAEEPDALRRADHRLADRARGAAGPRAAADRVGDLQPAARPGRRSGSTRRCATS